MNNVQVLIVEDAAEIRFNIAEILRSDGFTVLEASDGQAGLDIIRSKQPDIIICDIVMPILDGYGVLKQLRADPQTALIPFIFLTCKDTRSDQRQGMGLGADDYLIKPFRRHELLETLHAQLTKQSQRKQLSCLPTCDTHPISISAQALQSQIQVLQLREQETQAWIGGITHDLRAPLTTIKVALELLQRAPERSDRYLTIARQACTQSDELIEELLALYREEELGFEDKVQEEKRVYLCDLLERLQDGFQARCTHLNLNLKWRMQEDLSEYSLPSTLNLERVLTELLNNACKYTVKSGEIRFEAYISHRTPEFLLNGLSEGVQIFVRNESEIPAEALPYIFNKFYRGRKNLKQTVLETIENSSLPSGIGLGLSLVRQLTAQLGGKLEVDSKNGWTTFALWIPFDLNHE